MNHVHNQDLRQECADVVHLVVNDQPARLLRGVRLHDVKIRVPAVMVVVMVVVVVVVVVMVEVMVVIMVVVMVVVAVVVDEMLL